MDDIIPIRKPEIVGEAGGLVDESRLTLAIYGDELDPDEISRLLGCAPTRARRRGDARRSGPPWPQGAWLFSVEGKSPTGPDELVNLLLAGLPSNRGVWTDLRARFKVRLLFGIFIDRWNRGFELTPKAIFCISALGCEVGFDIYANPETNADG
jgi:hypothetical protein